MIWIYQQYKKKLTNKNLEGITFSKGTRYNSIFSKENWNETTSALNLDPLEQSREHSK